MARGVLTPQAIGIHGGGIDDITWTAGDATNDHQFVNTGREILLHRNGDASPHPCTVVSISDPYGRSGDITLTTGADDISCAGPFNPVLFSQAGGVVHVDLADDTSIEFAVVQYTQL